MNFQKSDVVVLMACVLLGCPKKAAPEPNGSEGTPTGMPSAGRDAEVAEGGESDAGSMEASRTNPEPPDDPDAVEQTSGAGVGDPRTEPPIVAWQGVRQDGLDVDHTIASLDVDATGAVFIGGSVRGPFAGSDYESWRLFVAKDNPDGALAWTWDADALAGRGQVSSVRGDDRGNTYFAGETATALGSEALSGGTDAFAGKLDRAGNLLWVRYAGTASFDGARALQVDAAGGLVLSGYAGGALPDQGEADADQGGFTLKLDPEGGHLWTRRHAIVPSHLSGDVTGALYAGEEGPSVMKLDPDGNTVWTTDIDAQSDLGDDQDDPEGGSSGDFISVSTAVDREGSALFVAGSYGGFGQTSVIFGFVGRLEPTTGELGWLVGLDADVTALAAAEDGSAVYVSTIFDCMAFDASGMELWRVPALSGNALSIGVAQDLFLAGTTSFSGITGTPGSGIAGARDWIVARLRQSDGGLL